MPSTNQMVTATELDNEVDLGNFHLKSGQTIGASSKCVDRLEFEGWIENDGSLSSSYAVNQLVTYGDMLASRTIPAPSISVDNSRVGPVLTFDNNTGIRQYSVTPATPTLGFVVEYRESGSGTWLEHETVTAKSSTYTATGPTGLSSGTTYEFRARHVDGAEDGENSSTVSASTTTGPYSTPTSFTVTDNGTCFGGEPTFLTNFSWSNTDPYSSVNIYHSSNLSTPVATALAGSTSANHVFEDTDTQYYGGSQLYYIEYERDGITGTQASDSAIVNDPCL